MDRTLFDNGKAGLLVEPSWPEHCDDLSVYLSHEGRFHALWHALTNDEPPAIYEDFQSVAWVSLRGLLWDDLDVDPEPTGDGDAEALTLCDCGCAVLVVRRWHWGYDGVDLGIDLLGSGRGWWHFRRTCERVWEALTTGRIVYEVILEPEQLASAFAPLWFKEAK